MQDRFLNIAELSEYLSIKRSTLYSYVESGLLPHYRIGKLVRFKQSEIDRWIETRKREVVHVERKVNRTLDKILPNKDIAATTRNAIDNAKKGVYSVDKGKQGQAKRARQGG